jgi:predicted O-methyltransferase YrrM
MFYSPESDRGWTVHSVYDGSTTDDCVSATLREMAGDPQAPGQSDIGIRNLIFAMAINLRPRRVLEIGAHIGSGTVVLGHALKVNGYGKLLSLEPADHYQRKAAAYVEKAGLSPFVEIIPDFSHSETCRQRLRSEAPFDLIFIDAAHDYSSVCFDLELSVSLLRDNGIIVMHDVGRHSPEMDPTGRGGPRQALYDFVSDEPDLRVVSFEHPLWLNSCGAAIVCKQKMEPAPKLVPRPHSALKALYHALGRRFTARPA